MFKNKVLFVCSHNSARSQMAEAICNQLCGERFEAESAGLEPGSLNPLAIEVMEEIGIDISGKETKSVFDLFKAEARYTWVITVCDDEVAEQCPIFPGLVQREHWTFADPSGFQGSHEENLARTREVRDAIMAQLEEWCSELCVPQRAA